VSVLGRPMRMKARAPGYPGAMPKTRTRILALLACGALPLAAAACDENDAQDIDEEIEQEVDEQLDEGS
jgi:hypothetical protein